MERQLSFFEASAESDDTAVVFIGDVADREVQQVFVDGGEECLYLITEVAGGGRGFRVVHLECRKADRSSQRERRCSSEVLSPRVIDKVSSRGRTRSAGPLSSTNEPFQPRAKRFGMGDVRRTCKRSWEKAGTSSKSSV